MAVGRAAVAVGVPAVGPGEEAEAGVKEVAEADEARAVPREWLAQEAEREGGGTPPAC